MMVYRGMDIGTAKPTAVERRGITHHMVDIVDPEDEFSVAEFRRTARQIMESGEAPIVIAGGSGLHFRSLVDPMSFAPTDPKLRAQLESSAVDDLVSELTESDSNAGRHVDLGNRRRVIRAVEILRLTGDTPSGRAISAEADELRRYTPEIPFAAVGVDPGGDLDKRISNRLQAMRSGGLVGEVDSLKNRLGRTARSAVGYREILRLLAGEMSEDETFNLIESNTRKLARKQRKWFQRDPRIQWIPWIEDEDARSQRALEVLG